MEDAACAEHNEPTDLIQLSWAGFWLKPGACALTGNALKGATAVIS
jgi:hypothetical protein